MFFFLKEKIQWFIKSFANIVIFVCFDFSTPDMLGELEPAYAITREKKEIERILAELSAIRCVESSALPVLVV